MAVKNTYPGVYISEKAGGPQPIEGSSTSIGCFVGFTLEGLEETPTDVVSYPDFEKKFGGFTSSSLVPTDVYNFFANGGTRAKICRLTGAGSLASAGSMTTAVTAEAMTVAPAFDGAEQDFLLVGANALDNTPVEPGTLTLTTSAGVGSENFTDNGNGTLTGSAGGSGTIDYSTGEISLTYNAAPAGGLTLSAAYEYQNFTFEMKWAGAAGDDFRVTIEGDPLHEDIATASFDRFIVLVERDQGDGTFSVVEQFEGIVLDDPTSVDYIATTLNDSNEGSEVITVTATGNDANPADLEGTAVTAEALTAAPAYDGATRTHTYTMAGVVAPNTLDLEVSIAYNAAALTGAATAGASFDFTIPGGAVEDDGNLSITTDQVIDETFTLTSAGDGTGALTGSEGGTGTIDFDTGVASLSPFVAFTGGETATGTWLHRPVAIVDDGEGGLSISSASTGPSNWSLDANGTNSIDYDGAGAAGIITLTWKNSASPIVGIPADGAVTTSNSVDYYTEPAADELNIDMTGGSDGAALTRSDVSAATLAGDQLGIFSLNKTEDLLQVVISDFQTDSLVTQDLIDYCDGRRDRFAIVSVPEGRSVDAAVSYKKLSVARNSNRYAMYYNHIEILDPVTEKSILVPHGGHVAGIYARTDANKNVAKAPAGAVDGALRASIGLENNNLSLPEVGTLNQNGINCAVFFQSTGRVIWGARTGETVGEFPYIQMRRLFMFVEKALYDAMQVYVFESNTPNLRARMKSQIESFLLGLFNTGHFAGATPADAYYVKDLTDNADVANGRIVFEIGLAAARPGEFLNFEFRPKTLSNA